uniref:Uncharacterized protein n=1 Tax=Daucus carota subsp. sativus TaxID=79200 RepID=A0A164U809_DAUCS
MLETCRHKYQSLSHAINYVSDTITGTLLKYRNIKGDSATKKVVYSLHDMTQGIAYDADTLLFRMYLFQKMKKETAGQVEENCISTEDRTR